MPAISLSRNADTPPVNLKVAIDFAQHVGFARREAGAFDGDAHRLLLEERHAERLAEHLLELGRREMHGLEALAPSQVGMHHVALDRPGPHDRHLDDEVVEGPGLQPRQHRHLRAALDLEGPDACRPGGSSHRCADPRPGWRRDRGRSPCGSARRSRPFFMQVSMPRASTSTFMNFRASMSSLSHSITWRSRIAAGSIGTRSSSRSRVRTKPPGCWLRWRGAPISWLASSRVRRSRRSVGLRFRSAKMVGADRLLRPAPDLRREGAEQVLGDARAPCRRRGARPSRGSGSRWSRARHGRGRRCRTPTA